MSRNWKMLVVGRTLTASGGGEHLTAAALEALRDEGTITLLQWDEPRIEEVNRIFGTTLRKEDFTIVRPSLAWRVLTAAMPFHLDLLKKAVQFRMMRRMSGEFDVVISFVNEIDVGVPAVQYVHYPWGLLPRPKTDLRWFHFSWLLSIYYELVRWLIDVDDRRIARNLTFVNSSWTGERFVERYGGSNPITLHPPVGAMPPGLSWEDRANRFVAVGRISPEKRLEDAILIIDEVRARGHDVRLSIVGLKDSRTYFDRIAAMAAEREWVTIREKIPQAELHELIGRSRYGLHAMPREHFGIAVAQMTAGGCLPFVHGDGGPAEIVGDPRLTFMSTAEAVDRIDSVLGNEELQAEIRRTLGSADRFGFDVFRRDLVDTLTRWMEASSPGPLRG